MIDILLATYNGEKYIGEQLESLLKQTYQDIRILIRDDGSTDLTLEIIEKYMQKYPEKIELIHDDALCGSAKRNFFQLLQYASSDYVMFCDQDDYWFTDKVEQTYEEMKRQEEKTKETPVLIFTNYEATDGSLKKMAVNEKQMQTFKYNLDFCHLLVQNYVTGCTMMVNKALYSKAKTYDDAILMHDWWLALYASAFGKIVHMNKSTMFYRQHGNNCVGAVNIKSIKYRIRKLRDPKTKASHKLYINQATSFYNMYGSDLSENTKKLLLGFLEIDQFCKPIRIYKLIKGLYLKSDFIRILGQLWYI